MLKKNVLVEPGIKFFEGTEKENSLFLFSEIPHYSTRFDGLKENRDLVINLLQDIIAPLNKKKLDGLVAPCIGVHIRLGDFRKLKESETFGNAGTVRTPENYFIQMINGIRELNGTYLPVSVFTDGTRDELPDISLLPNISFMEGNNDIVDLMLLSRSKIIITSASSTFSYWAAFISEAVVIMHPGFLGYSIRPEEVNVQFYEGAFDKNSKKLVEIIKSVQCTF
jgi:hypothetical protein